MDLRDAMETVELNIFCWEVKI